MLPSRQSRLADLQSVGLREYDLLFLNFFLFLIPLAQLLFGVNGCASETGSRQLLVSEPSQRPSVLRTGLEGTMVKTIRFAHACAKTPTGKVAQLGDF